MDLKEIALLEERRQALGLSEIAEESRPILGGTAGRSFPGSWLNNAVGIGLNESFHEPEIDQLIAWMSEKGLPTRLEIAAFADEAFLRAIERRGFVLREFEWVFFRPLSTQEPACPIHTPPSEISIGRIDPADAERVREYATVTCRGFAPSDKDVSESDLDVFSRCVRHARTSGFVAYVAGRIVGAGAIDVWRNVGALFALAVLPEWRRKGVQQALIAARSNHAANAGATVATIGSRPGQSTERNVRRMGFQLGYTKVVMVRDFKS